MLQIGPAKQLAGQIETKNVPCAVLKRSATSDNSLYDQKDVVGRVALADDHLVAVVTDGPAPKRNDGALHQFPVVTWDRRPAFVCGQCEMVKSATAVTRDEPVDTAQVGHMFPRFLFGLS